MELIKVNILELDVLKVNMLERIPLKVKILPISLVQKSVFPTYNGETD